MAETRSSLIGSGQLKEQFKELASEHPDWIPTSDLATQYTCTYKEEQDGHCRFTTTFAATPTRNSTGRY